VRSAEWTRRLARALRATCAVLALVCSTPAMPQDAIDDLTGDPAEPVESADAISREAMDAALARIKADPNLNGERKRSTLRWAGKNKPANREPPSWLGWLKALFAFLAQNGRFLFWGLLTVLALVLTIYLARMFKGWRMPARPRGFEVPSFVRDLDIRPESLPDDIGAAARQLWDSGEHRAALSLLYRGLLSRLAHVHHVPIKDSTTEGDCITLASRHLLDEHRKTYVTQLVRLWQRAVYGGVRVEDAAVHALCEGFARALNDPEATHPAGVGPATGVAS